MTPFSSYDDFLDHARAFHGSASPGLLAGASMVELALHSLGHTQRYHALCETSRSLPDAVQLLTACTAGNGRLHVLELGRFALSLYRQADGRGVRVWLDPEKLEAWPDICRWSRGETAQGKALVKLERDIRKAGISILSAAPISMSPAFLARSLPEALADIIPCPVCGELHPASAGQLCRACQGHSPYVPRHAEDILGAELR